jgi:hypothetical protein
MTSTKKIVNPAIESRSGRMKISDPIPIRTADFLKEYLKTHHPDISRRVIATESADLSAVTESEIESLAKRHMIAAV